MEEGADIGVVGATYYVSDDNGRIGATDLYRLGTGSRITLSGISAAIELDPPAAQVTALIALAVELRADRLAHYADAVAHNSADTASAALIALAAPTTGTEAIAVVNQVRLADISHYADATAHDSPDFINEITLAAATTLQGAVLLAVQLKTKANLHNAVSHIASTAALKAATASSVAIQVYTAASGLLAGGVSTLDAQPGRVTFTTAGGTASDAPATATIAGTNAATDAADTEVVNVSQTAATVSSTKYWYGTGLSVTYSAGDGTGATVAIGTAARVHNSADATNTIAATSPTSGTIVAGDIVRVSTVAPAWSNTLLADAFTAYGNSNHDASIILISGRILPANFATIVTGLNALEGKGKRCVVITQARKRADGETEAQWRAALDSEWAEYLDYRVAVCAGDGLATFTDGTLSGQYARGFSTQAVRRLMSIDRFRTAWEVALGRLEDFTISNSNGIVVGHDEATSPGLKASKFWTVYRPSSSLVGRVAFLNFDITRFNPQDRVRSVRVNRITNRMIAEIQAVGLSLLGKTYDVKRTGATSGTLSQSAIDAIRPKFEQPIQNGFQADISDWNASDLIVIGQTVTIDPDTDAFDLVVTINYTPKLPVGRVRAIFAVRLGV